MQKILTKGRMALLIIFGVLIIDQLVKVYIKTHMFLHDFKRVTDWFYIYFTENNGMAFGMEIFGKLFLTVFRIAAVGVIGWMLYRFVKANLKWGFVACVAFIMAGAIGNIIDSVFYGVLFSESNYSQIATLLPAEGGYAPLLYGKVVDMLYFPLIETDWPQWMPWVGGEHFIFFSPIFNIADASISCGIIAVLLFYNKYWTDCFQVLKDTDEKKL